MRFVAYLSLFFAALPALPPSAHAQTMVPFRFEGSRPQLA